MNYGVMLRIQVNSCTIDRHSQLGNCSHGHPCAALLQGSPPGADPSPGQALPRRREEEAGPDGAARDVRGAGRGRGGRRELRALRAAAGARGHAERAPQSSATHAVSKRSGFFDESDEEKSLIQFSRKFIYFHDGSMKLRALRGFDIEFCSPISRALARRGKRAALKAGRQT